MGTTNKNMKYVINKTPNINKIFKFIIAIILYIFTLFLVFPNYMQKVNIPYVGDIVKKPLILKRNFRYEDKEETDKLIYYAQSSISPVFDMPKNIKYETISKIKDMFSFMRISYDNEIPIDKIYNDFLIKYNEPINRSIFSNAIVNDLHIGYENKIINVLEELFDIGITSKNNLNSDTLNLILDNGIFLCIFDDYIIEEKILPKNRVLFLEDLRVELNSIVGEKYKNLDIMYINIISSIINAFLKDNLIYNPAKTKEKMDETLASIQPVYNTIKKGFIVLDTGEKVTEDKYKLARLLFGQKFNSYYLSTLIGQSLFILLLFISLGYIIIKYKIPFYTNLKNFILFSLEYVLIVSLTYIFYNHILYNLHLNIHIPFYIYTVIPMFTMINSLLGAKKGMSSIITLCITTLAANIADANIFELISLYILSIGTSMISKKISNRNSIFFIGFAISIYLCVVSAIEMLLNNDLNINYLTFLLSILSGFIQTILVIILLPIFEYILETATIFRLQELADLNNPLLRQLQMDAPGTYHHSISIANLVEAIAVEIGEDARLACVSAYYHDIGKIKNPLYYIENSNINDNRHNKLKPTLSTSIVKAHVNLGVDIAKKYKLPKEVIAAIKEHHGTSLIKYFYAEAIKENPDVDINLFRYPGPKPQSKITAILMILDSIEAASRTLDIHKREELEKIIDNIINDKMSQGELNDSGLTLKDIEIIKKMTFQKIMVSLHERIKYPELPDEKDSNQEKEENKKDDKKQLSKNSKKYNDEIKENISKKISKKYKNNNKELKYYKNSKESKESIKK